MFRHGIAVCNVPDYGTEEVADTAMSLMLSIMRKTWALGMKSSSDEWRIHEAKGSVRIRGKKYVDCKESIIDRFG